MPLEELKSELEYAEFELKRYCRWWDEKNDYGYHEDVSFDELEVWIERENEKIRKLKDELNRGLTG